MKTKIFKHKLLAVGTAAALGICMGGTALAGAKSYSTNELTFLITAEDAAGTEFPLSDLQFAPDPGSEASSVKQEQPDPNNPVSLNEADSGNVDAETCVGILPGNPDCSANLPNVFTQHNIGPGYDFCRGKANIPFIPPGTGIGESPAQANATSECQFDRQNWGEGDGGNGFAASFVVSQPTTLRFDATSDPRMEAFCHDDPLFNPSATASMTFTITVTDNNGNEIFSFNPNGNVDANETTDEANLNLGIFCNGAGDVQNYDPIDSPGPTNDCTGGNPALCEYSSTTPVLAAGGYRMVVAMSQNSEAHKEDVVNGDGDHFLCYKSFGKFLREEVNLVDQFDTDDGINFDVLKPKMFCNPAIKPELDPLAILEPGPHYLSYKINEAHREPRHERKMAEVQNQFGTMIVETFKPDRLMVPSGKSLDLAVPPTIPAAGPNTNHYKCYTVKATGFQSPGDVAVLDQFTDDDGKKLGIVRPARLCNPVEKTRSNGVITPIIEDPNNEFDHLMCYSVRAGAGERLHKKTKVLSNNQFREEELVLKRELEFCVPSKKTLLTP